jgi:hypothetical protein
MDESSPGVCVVGAGFVQVEAFERVHRTFLIIFMENTAADPSSFICLWGSVLVVSPIEFELQLSYLYPILT